MSPSTWKLCGVLVPRSFGATSLQQTDRHPLCLPSRPGSPVGPGLVAALVRHPGSTQQGGADHRLGHQLTERGWGRVPGAGNSSGDVPRGRRTGCALSPPGGSGPRVVGSQHTVLPWSQGCGFLLHSPSTWQLARSSRGRAGGWPSGRRPKARVPLVVWPLALEGGWGCEGC